MKGLGLGKYEEFKFRPGCKFGLSNIRLTYIRLVIFNILTYKNENCIWFNSTDIQEKMLVM